MSGFCKDCRYWEQRYDWSGTSKAEWGHCNFISPVFEDVVYESKAAVEAEDIEALFLTAPDFGCVHFEVKEM